MAETQGSKTVSTKLERIAEIAKRMPGVALTSLSHHIDMDWMREAHRRTRKDGAVGVDAQTAAEYAVNLEENLASLLDRAKSGDHYRAAPVRRVYIPKGSDKKKLRPIGIPSFEDKVLQKVVSMVLNAVYEQDFLDCSYGFRPRRSQQVLDTWFEQDIKPRLQGRGFLVRFADDGVFAFETERDARRVLAVLPKRFEKYGLRLHPEKTRLVPFRRPPKYPSSGDDGGVTKPASFNFLGFTHYWGRSLNGNWVVRRKTEKSRFGRARKAIADWCKANRHRPIKEQHEMLTKKLRGHDAYYGITGNGRALSVLRCWVERDWLKWLRTRSGAAPRNWEWMQRILEVFPLPPPRIVHSAVPRVANP
jgi:hypothetical protein